MLSNVPALTAQTEEEADLLGGIAKKHALARERFLQPLVAAKQFGRK
jgi:hypothetical protein